MLKPGWIDVVDLNDQVVKVIERTPEWDKTRPDPHRFIQVYGITPTGEVVLSRRAAHLRFAPGYLDAPVGGLVISGEEYLACAQRKVQSELKQNFTFTPLSKVCDLDSKTAIFDGFGMIYTAQVDVNKLTLDPEAADALMVYPLTALPDLLQQGQLTTGARHAL